MDVLLSLTASHLVLLNIAHGILCISVHLQANWSLESPSKPEPDLRNTGRSYETVLCFYIVKQRPSAKVIRGEGRKQDRLTENRR